MLSLLHKRLIVLRVCISVILLSVFYLDVFSQCSHWFPFNEGITFEYTFYNKKDKQTGRISYGVSEVIKQGDDFTADAILTLSESKPFRRITVTPLLHSPSCAGQEAFSGFGKYARNLCALAF